MPPQIAEPPELELLQPRWMRLATDEAAPRRWRTCLLASVILHLMLVPLIPYMPMGSSFHPDSVGARIFSARNATRLLAPVLPKPPQMTQKEANVGRVSPEVSMADLAPRTAVAQASAPIHVPAAAPSPSPPPLIEPPKVEVANTTPLPSGPAPQLPPQIQPVEKPRNPFEKVGATMGTSSTVARLEPAKQGVQEAINGLARASGTTLSVGDETGTGSGGEVLGQAPRPGAPGSRLELVSDPQGVDFKPYLIQVLAAVRRNWFAVFPESARLGQRGRVVIVFSILRNGRVGKLVFGSESGISGLDRAAVAGVSASDPFPPLPEAFRGDRIELRMAFAYNQPRR